MKTLKTCVFTLSASFISIVILYELLFKDADLPDIAEVLFSLLTYALFYIIGDAFIKE